MGKSKRTTKPVVKEASVEKKLPRRGRRIRVLVVVVLCCLGLGGGGLRIVAPWVTASLRTSPTFVIKHVEYAIEDSLKRESVRSVAKVKVGGSIMEVHPEEVARRIEKIAWVKRARVARLYPNRLRISVEEREPVALVCAGRVFWADAEGRLIGLKPGKLPQVPVVTGLSRVSDSTGTYLGERDIGRLRAVLRAVGANSHLPKLSQLEFINSDAVRLRFAGMQATVEVEESGLALRLADLKRLMDALNDGDAALARRIDLRYDNVAFVE